VDLRKTKLHLYLPHIANKNTPTGSQLTSEDRANIERTLVNVENEIAYIRSLVQGQQFLRKPKKKPKLNKYITNNMLLFTIVWQLVLLIIVSLCELIFENEKAVLDVAITLGSLIQCVQVLFVIITSVKLVKQLKHRTASGWFLVQSYLSITILYAGIYTLVYQIESSSFNSAQLKSESAEIFSLYTIFLYFSGTTMTTGKFNRDRFKDFSNSFFFSVGFGDIYPTVWYTQVVVLSEAILSVVFTTVIFVKGLSHFGGQVAIANPQPPKEEQPINLSYGSTD